MRIYFVYRCLYGEDFIQPSILSVKDYADKIIICWSDRPWGYVTEVNYKGETYPVPMPVDNIMGKIDELNLPNVFKRYRQFSTPTNQVSKIINEVVLGEFERPDLIVFLEPDMVWRKDELETVLRYIPMKAGYVQQIELWRTPGYRIPHRNRCGAYFYNMSYFEQIPNTGKDGWIINEKAGELPALVHNFGFCVSARNMFWKHLIALGMSDKIGDRRPNEDWYEKVWLSWDIDSNNKNLEISAGKEHAIPYAIPYDTNQLPETIKEMYGLS